MSRIRRGRISNRRFANAIARKMKRAEMNKEQEKIDYNKLAYAIVKAQEIVENKKTAKDDVLKDKTEKVRAGDFFKSVGNIIINKTETNGTMISGLFGLLISIFFNLLAILGAVAFVVAIVLVFKTAFSMDWSWSTCLINILCIFLLAMATVLIGLFTIILRASANEISSEKDRNYVVNVFAGLTSFVALIVAVIALYKGIN